MTTTITQYSKTEAALAELRTKYGRTFDVSTSEGEKEARVARAEIKKYRTDLEKMRQELKAPIIEQGKLIDSEARRITEELLSLEEPIDALIVAKEKRAEEERKAAEAKRAAEQRASLELQNKMRAAITWAVGKSAAALTECLAGLDQLDVPDNEFRGDVEGVRTEVRAALENMRDVAMRNEADDKRRAEERAELERLRSVAAKEEADRKAKLEAEQRAAEQKAAAERKRIEDEERAARERIAAEERKAAAARAEADAAAAKAREEADRAARDARLKEEARLREERAKIDAERDAAEALARKAREEAEAKKRADEAAAAKKAAEAEAKRQHKLSGRELLATFLKRYGDDADFASVATFIRAFLSESEAPAKKAARS